MSTVKYNDIDREVCTHFKVTILIDFVIIPCV